MSVQVDGHNLNHLIDEQYLNKYGYICDMAAVCYI
jgi:hypothetical protein